MTTAPTGALLVSITVPTGNKLAAESFRPSSVILRSVFDTKIDSDSVISFGVSQGMFPFQYSSFFVLGVPPLSTDKIIPRSEFASNVVVNQFFLLFKYGMAMC